MQKIRTVCFAELLRFAELSGQMLHQGDAALMRNVLIVHPEEDSHVFVFDYGVSVFCNVGYDTEKRLMDVLLKYAVHPFEPFIEEELSFQASTEGKEFHIRHDLIESDDSGELTLLSLGHALAQSTKLASFEDSIEKIIEQTKFIPVTLAEKGKISLSRNRLAKERGRVYLEKSRIILQFNLLDPPEFIWEYPELEQYYLGLARYLEITPRAEVLKHRLEVIQELLEMMADEQKHNHSSLLEWIIIILIAIEIVLFFVH